VHQGPNVDFKMMVIKQREEEVREIKEKTTEQLWTVYVVENFRQNDSITAHSHHHVK
jgi:hypothetical protein